jgi:hypothetical protein
MKTHQAFRFELDPSNVALGSLASHAGGARFAHGWGLALVKARLDQAARLRERALTEGASARESEALARTIRVPWSLASLRREWNQAKAQVAPWWAENSKECYNSGLDSLARGLDAWQKSGERVPNPKHLSRYQRRITRRQHELSRRQGPAKGRKPSERWAGSKRQLAKLHASAARSRADGLHSYKCSWYGSALVVADRWYPSSKTCSSCGWRKPSLPLAEREFVCKACGLVIDRDLNAALNLAALVRAGTEGTASSGGNRPDESPAYAQGEEKSTGLPGCSSLNCEDGTGRSPRPGKTATAARQRTAPEPALIGSDR